MLDHLRKVMVGGDQHVRERLVVAQQNVVARLEPLDHVELEQQRLDLGVGRHELHRADGGHHPLQAHRQLRRAGIGGDALAQIAGLADVERVAGVPKHAVHAGRSGQRREVRLHHVHAGGEPAPGALPSRDRVRRAVLALLHRINLVVRPKPVNGAPPPSPTYGNLRPLRGLIGCRTYPRNLWITLLTATAGRPASLAPQMINEIG